MIPLDMLSTKECLSMCNDTVLDLKVYITFRGLDIAMWRLWAGNSDHWCWPYDDVPKIT